MDANLSVHSIVIAAPEQVSCPLGDEVGHPQFEEHGLLRAESRRRTRVESSPAAENDQRAARRLLDEYDVEAGRCESDLLELLEKMRSEGLILVRSAAARARILGVAFARFRASKLRRQFLAPAALRLARLSAR